MSRMIGLKAKIVSQKIGNPDVLPSESETTTKINKNFSEKRKAHPKEIFKQHEIDTET